MQALVRAGLSAGDRLMAAHPSNPDGHYEDLDIVALHQDILRSQQRDWHSVGQPRSPDSDEYGARADSIINRFSRKNTSWGFKDPRTCLFIQWWYQRLTNPAVVLVYRHYLACNRSLRVREAQELALSPKPKEIELRFWSDPHHGLKLWLDYNRALLTFVQQCPQDVLVVPYDALLSGFNLVNSVNQRFGLSLNAECNTGIRQRPVGIQSCLLYTSPSPRDGLLSRMPSSA